MDNRKWTEFKNLIFVKSLDVYEKCAISLIGLALVLLIIIIILSYLTSYLIENGGISRFFWADQLGPIGDFLSGITTPCFTLAAFCLLYGSYKLQKKEMRDSSMALQAQAKSLEKQIQIIQEQNDQKIFFDLLNLLDKNRNISQENIKWSKFKDIMNYNDRLEGNYFFKINEIFKSYNINFEDKKSLIALKRINEQAYNAICSSAREDLHTYFESMTAVVRVLFEYSKKEDNDKIYKLFLIAFLSGISLNEKRYLIMYANSDFLFKDTYIIEILKKLKILEWNKENINYEGKL